MTAHQDRLRWLHDDDRRGTLSRREVLCRAAALGVSVPLCATLRPQSGLARQTSPVPPTAKRVAQTLQVGSLSYEDPYAWLENPGDPEVMRYLEAENAYAEAILAPATKRQEALFQELLGRIKLTDRSVLTPWHGYLYYTRWEEGKDYAIVCRQRDEPDATEEILLDLNRIAGDYLALGGWLPSPDNRYLAYELDETGDEFSTIFILDTQTGLITDRLRQSQSFEWGNDSRTLFYCKQHPERVWPYAHYRHTLGEKPRADALLYEEPVAEFELYTTASKDRAYIFLYSETVDTNEVRYVPADRPTAVPTLFASRQRGVRSYLEHHGGEFLIHTDDVAPNFKLAAAPVADPAHRNWREIVPHRDEIVLDRIEVFARHFALFGRAQGFSQAWIHDLAGNETAPLLFDEAVYVVSPGQNWEFDTAKLRVRYSSPVTPDTDLEIDMVTGERTLLKELEVIGGHDPSRYVTERLYATAADGTRVPISLVALREAPAGIASGPRPLRLDGYGAYGLNVEPWFSLARLTLIDRGITFAQAHVRGGGELGRSWWDDGRLLQKWNTFTDFIACAEHLIAEGHTAPDRLIAHGASAGGLLMGVVATQRPDLFRAVVAEVPSVELIGGLTRSANGPYNQQEFGDPSDPEAYAYLRGYSPYENVRPQHYPLLLVTGGLKDRRVDYWEPAKWVAKLRHEMPGDTLLLLQIDMSAGHFGGTGRQKIQRQSATFYSFILMALGMLDEPPVAAAATPPAARRQQAAVVAT